MEMLVVVSFLLFRGLHVINTRVVLASKRICPVRVLLKYCPSSLLPHLELLLGECIFRRLRHIGVGVYLPIQRPIPAVHQPLPSVSGPQGTDTT